MNSGYEPLSVLFIVHIFLHSVGLPFYSLNNLLTNGKFKIFFCFQFMPAAPGLPRWPPI